MAFQADFTATLKVTEGGTNDFGGPTFTPMMEKMFSMTEGVSGGQANQCFFDERTVATAANDDLDLAGALASAFGATLTMAKIVAIFIINAPRVGAANTTNLTIGAATNPFLGFLGGTTPTIGPIRPGGFVFIGCPDNVTGIGAVTAATADILRIANSAGASATYQIAIIARNA